MLRTQPQPWRPEDSLLVAKYLAWTLGRNWGREMLRLRLTEELGVEQTRALIPVYPADGVNVLSEAGLPAGAVEPILALDDWLAGERLFPGPGVGSNAWVVSGRYTTSGQPLLANDLHQALHTPSTWYLAELKGDRLHVIGATVPGLPVVVFGHNGRVSWGGTNLVADTQDLYIERLHPHNRDQYEVDGQWVEVERREEFIAVKGRKKPVKLTVRRTRHGPLLGEWLHHPSPHPVALRWIALDADDTTLDALLRINYAPDWEAFKEAFRHHVVPSLSFVYADVEGHIGYMAAGRIPIRAKGTGMLPVPGWNHDHDWVGWVPFDELPQAFDPDAGFLATANNRVSNDAYPYLITHDWEPPYRAGRIVNELHALRQGGRKLSVDDMRALQADQTSLQARELRPRLLAVEVTTASHRQALNSLDGWNGELTRDSVAASIYQAWYHQLIRVLFADKLSAPVYERFARTLPAMLIAKMLAEPDHAWCDQRTTPQVESCADASRIALELGLDDLEQRLGADVSHWQWGRLHQAQYPHVPFSRVKMLKQFFHRQIPSGGDAFTVNTGQIRFSERYAQRLGATYRQVVDLGHLATSRFMHAPGQSGHVLSRHYDDLLKRHRDVRYISMRFGDAKLGGDRLVLQPARADSPG